MAVSVGIVLLVLILVLTLGTILINLLLAAAPRRGKRPDVTACAPEPQTRRAAVRAVLGAPSARRYFSSEVDFYLRDWLDSETARVGGGDRDARFYRFVGALLDYYPASSEDGDGPARPDAAEVERKLMQAGKDRGSPLDPFTRRRVQELARRVQILYDFADAHARQPQSRPQEPGGIPPDRG